ncbi:MAG: response regulator [Desulfobacterales bacterium]|jgi:two-component system, OmpR family, response regulator CpxR|nr:response regulator [Desulfobacteraceae bacterium]MBT7085750.1 response regulator [Desulfobacterales bacterium]
MSIVSITSGIFTNGKHVVEKLASETGGRIVRDSDLIEILCRRHNIKTDKAERLLWGKPLVFNQFTHEKERTFAYMKSIIAEFLKEDNIIFHGLMGHLIPPEVSHVLKILVITELNEKEAEKKTRPWDEEAISLTGYLFKKGPWDSSLFDILIPSYKVDMESAVRLIMENLLKDAVKETAASREAVEDFTLAARVETILLENGHDVIVSADDGFVKLKIDKNFLMLSRLQDELKSIILKIPGVKDVEVGVGKNFYKADAYRRFDFDVPSKILLVDDERVFVQTLSERLRMRNVGTHVVYDGGEALDFIKGEEPEIIILDLKMPEVDGFEVLRRVKHTNPDIEVIVLTGHGSEKDEKLCMELGAFAFLQKPVNIEILNESIKNAYDKIKSKRGKDAS